MKKFLIKTKVILVKSNNLTFKKYKLNPFNPLTYITILIAFLIGIVCFGVIGIWSEIDLTKNPFKYQ